MIFLRARQRVPKLLAQGKQTYPDYSDLAPPLHAPIEKDRVRLQVSNLQSLNKVTNSSMIKETASQKC